MGAEQSTPGEEESPATNIVASAQASAAASQSVPLVVVGPSGVGKGTLIAQLMASDGSRFGFTTSHTTRSPRKGEQNGEHYHFVTKEDFCKDIAEGKFLEYAEVHGNLYGTSFSAVQAVQASGSCCVLDVDVQGARNIRKSGARAIIVFLAPPSLEDLAKRLAGRGSETIEQMEKRLSMAKSEINSLNETGLYDYLIINDNVEEAGERLLHIANRAVMGLDPEPGQMPEQVIIEETTLPDLSLLTTNEAPSSPPSSSPAPTSDPSPAPTEAPPTDLPTPSTEPAPTTSEGQQVDDVGIAALADAAAAPLPPLNVVTGSGAGAATEAQVEAAGLMTEHTTPVQPPSPRALSSQGGASAEGGLSSQGGASAEGSLSSQGGASVEGGLSPSASAQMGGLAQYPHLQGKIALVTGASSGIGWAVCETLALAGLRVVAVARRKEKLEDLQQQMHNVLGVPLSSFLPVVCDITKEAEVATLPKIVAKRWPEAGGIDILINNAGMSKANASLFDGDVGNWVAMLSTNVLGTCMCIKTVLQDMGRRNSYGHIVNMVGLSGHRIPDGPQGGGFYCATKSAVKTITEGLRQEARGKGLPLRISAISPGIVETEFFSVKYDGDEEAARQATSAFDCLQPEDIAKAILWCLSTPENVEVNDIVIRPTSQLL